MYRSETIAEQLNQTLELKGNGWAQCGPGAAMRWQCETGDGRHSPGLPAARGGWCAVTQRCRAWTGLFLLTQST